MSHSRCTESMCVSVLARPLSFRHEIDRPISLLAHSIQVPMSTLPITLLSIAHIALHFPSAAGFPHPGAGSHRIIEHLSHRKLHHIAQHSTQHITHHLCHRITSLTTSPITSHIAHHCNFG
eukprot:13349146-Alexandrium_andersonii.AAC.1